MDYIVIIGIYSGVLCDIKVYSAEHEDLAKAYMKKLASENGCLDSYSPETEEYHDDEYDIYFRYVSGVE